MMSALAMKQMNATPTPCAPTLKDHTFVAVNVGMLGMAEIVRVSRTLFSFSVLSTQK